MKRSIRTPLLALAFHLLYNEFAFSYDSVSRLVSLNQWRRWQRDVLPYLPAPTSGVILELAHGTGALQVDLLRRGYATVAYDLSPYMGRIAQKRLSRAGLATDFARGDALALPFASGSFTALVATFPTAFILHKDCLREMYRVLAAQGSVIILMSASLEGLGLRRSLIRFLYRITGQSSAAAASANASDSFQRAFADYGFLVEPVTVKCKNSIVQLYLLRKIISEVANQGNKGLAFAAKM